MTARLKIACEHTGGPPGNRHPMLATVVSVYAPTFRASAKVKEKLFSDLQASLDRVDEHDLLLIIGDFNARVGSSERAKGTPVWDGVRGFHGVGRRTIGLLCSE